MPKNLFASTYMAITISERISSNFFCRSPFTISDPSIGMILITVSELYMKTSPYTPSPIFLQFFSLLKLGKFKINRKINLGIATKLAKKLEKNYEAPKKFRKNSRDPKKI